MIWMDINMPIMGGFEATKMIREKETILNVEPSIIIACTAEPILNEEEMDNYKQSGFDSVRSFNLEAKPVSKKCFEDIITKYMGITL